MVPKEYQLEAYNILKNYDKCILSLPCGMGQSSLLNLESFAFWGKTFITSLINGEKWLKIKVEFAASLLDGDFCDSKLFSS